MLNREQYTERHECRLLQWLVQLAIQHATRKLPGLRGHRQPVLHRGNIHGGRANAYTPTLANAYIPALTNTYTTTLANAYTPTIADTDRRAIADTNKYPNTCAHTNRACPARDNRYCPARRDSKRNSRARTSQRRYDSYYPHRWHRHTHGLPFAAERLRGRRFFWRQVE